MKSHFDLKVNRQIPGTILMFWIKILLPLARMSMIVVWGVSLINTMIWPTRVQWQVTVLNLHWCSLFAYKLPAVKLCLVCQSMMTHGRSRIYKPSVCKSCYFM